MGHRERILREKLIVLQAYHKTRKTSNNLTLHLEELEKEQQTTPIVSRWKEIIKIRAEINEIESKNFQKIKEIKSWVFLKDKQD